MKYSVLMSVYKNDEATFLREALTSVYEKQTRKPDEIVVVFDGPLTEELYEVLDAFAQDKKDIVKYYPQSENRGLGQALRIGTDYCTGDYIFRMDSDDISLPTRFEKQIEYIEAHPETDVLGTDIAEFNEDINEKNKRVRSCPADHDGIVKMGKRRSPTNHVSVCIKRASLVSCGGYESHPYVEDYFLWMKMIANGCRFANMHETLVLVRVGNGFNSKRSDSVRVREWKFLQKFMVEKKLINRFEALINMLLIRVFVSIPPKMKTRLYDMFLRKKKDSDGRYSDEELKKLQAIETDVLAEIIRVCEQENITYFAVGGTALGAMRHDGFIPWDDDIDIGMLRPDYDRFLKLAPSALKEGYTLQHFSKDPKTASYFAKVRKDGTRFVEDSVKHIRMHHGVFVDIMPYDEIPADEEERKAYRSRCNFLMQLYVAKSVRKACITQDRRKQMIAAVVRSVLHIMLIPIPKKLLFKKLDEQLQCYNGKETGFVSTRGLVEVEAPVSDLIPTVKHKFESIEIDLPAKTDTVLRRQYRDYMQLPPEDKRVNHAPVVLKL